RRARAGRDRARRGRGPQRPRALGRDPAQPTMNDAAAANKKRLVKVTLDEASIGRSGPDVEHERAVAIYDLLEENSFAPVGHEGGPYWLHLAAVSNRLVFDVRPADEAAAVPHP